VLNSRLSNGYQRIGTLNYAGENKHTPQERTQNLLKASKDAVYKQMQKKQNTRICSSLVTEKQDKNKI